MMSPRFTIYLLLLLAISVYGLKQRNRLSLRYRALSLLVSTVFVSETISRILSYTIGNSMPTYHFLIVAEFIIYWYLYHKKGNILWGALFLSGVLYSLLNSLYIQSFWEFPTNAIILLGFCIVLSSLLDLKKLLRTPETLKLTAQPDFWFNLGGLVYYSLTFFSLSMMNIGMDVFPDWIYHLIFFASNVMYIAYGYSIFLNSRNSKDDLNHNHHRISRPRN